MLSQPIDEIINILYIHYILVNIFIKVNKMVMRNGLAYIDPIYNKLIVLKMRPELMKIEIINQHKGE
jgi:hypothetical protein